MERKSENMDIKQLRKSILIKHGSVEDDDSFFHSPMRPRAMTDPISPRPCFHVRFDLPDIVVDDCSENEELEEKDFEQDEISKELANTSEGAFFVYKSPPRQRSNTCPESMFSKRKERKHRPPTPPPADRISPESFPRYPSWERVDFSRHQLDCVEEVKEVQVSAQEAAASKTDSPKRSRKSLQSKTVKTSSVKETKETTHSSPPVSRLVNGHVGSKSSGIRDVIQTNA